MAKQKRSSPMNVKYQDSFERPMRNRGEELNEPKSNLAYSYAPADQYDAQSQERAIRRHEVRSEYSQMYENEQRRNERSYARTRDMENEFYAGVDPRRRKEIADGGMVREDHMEMANLPRQAIHCEYPRFYYYQTPYNDALIRGADPVLDDNRNSNDRFLNPLDPNLDF